MRIKVDLWSVYTLLDNVLNTVLTKENCEDYTQLLFNACSSDGNLSMDFRWFGAVVAFLQVERSNPTLNDKKYADLVGRMFALHAWLSRTIDYRSSDKVYYDQTGNNTVRDLKVVQVTPEKVVNNL